MKKLLFLLLLAPVFCLAQDDEYPNPYRIKFLDTTINGSKSELFLLAQSWMAANYKSANDVVQMIDKEAGRIIGKGSLKAPAKPMGMGNYYWVRYTITIDVKDNRIRCVLSDFVQDGSSYPNGSPNGGSLDNDRPAQRGLFGMQQVTWDAIREYTWDYGVTLLKQFRKDIKSGVANPTDEDGF